MYPNPNPIANDQLPIGLKTVRVKLKEKQKTVTQLKKE
jgi:hypothetical protein